VRRQRWSGLWVQFEELATRKRHWSFLPECGPRASYRPAASKARS
jgi:hypothetical protein